jgi:glycosyltransferase involved in cell wall biosynthesis
MLEAMASGCLVIGSATAPVQEVIRDGRNGVLVDFFDADRLARTVSTVLAEPDGYAALRTEAIETVRERYSLTRGLSGYLDLLGLGAPSPGEGKLHAQL